MRVGNTIFKIAIDEGLPDLPSLEFEEYEKEKPEESEEEAEEDVTDIPGIPPIPTVTPESATLTPGATKGADLDTVIEQHYTNDADRILANRAASVAQSNPKSYYTSNRLRYTKERFYDPITAWVLDNKVLEDPELTIDWLETQGRRSEVDFLPYVHAAANNITDKDPLRLLHAENVWRSEIFSSYLPKLWELSLRKAKPTEEGRLFLDDDTLFKFQALGREIGRRGFADFFQNRVMPVLNNMIDIRLEQVKESPLPASEKVRDKQTLKQWRRQLLNLHRKIEMGKESNILNVIRLIKVANKLDKIGEFKLSMEIDNILYKIDK